MASVKTVVSKTRLIVATSAPAVGLLLMSRVKAAGVKVHPRELEIYDEPNIVQEIVLEETASPLEVKVSTGRKLIWGYWDNVKGFVAKARSTFEMVSLKSFEFVELISTDGTFQIKVGSISAAVLVGALLAGRGRRPFRRTFYSAGLGTVAVSLSYPNDAINILLSGYMRIKGFTSDQIAKYNEIKQTNESKIEETAAVDPIIVEEPAPVAVKETEFMSEEVAETSFSKPDMEELIKEEDPPVLVIPATESSDSFLSYIPFIGWFFKSKSSNISEGEQVGEECNTVSKEKGMESAENVQEDSKQDSRNAQGDGDYGQSNPEDKDMYSTRS